MIPRLKPYLGNEELLALFHSKEDAVACFEAEFAKSLKAQHAIAFPYGRSALWAFFKAIGLENGEVVLPAYTCVVVAHAIVLSGNSPRFVDITLYDYNMDLDQVAEAISEQTRAVVATHLFGYPLDVDGLAKIVSDAERRYGRKIWVIQDCAHAFDTAWQGRLVCNAGDVALFGLNISKMMTSIFGGMLTTDDASLAARLRTWRDSHLYQPNARKSLQRRLYLLATYPAFSERIYGLVNWLQEATPLLDRLTKAYHLDEKIHFPPDYRHQMLPVEAQVGLAQLRKYPQIVQRRQENAHFYNEQLQGRVPWELPPLVKGATYSHYVIRVPNREEIMRTMARQGVQLGQLIEYSVPHMTAYSSYAGNGTFPNSLLCSQQTINLPMQAGLSAAQRDRVIACLKQTFV